MTAARMVARLTGPLPVRLAAASSLKVRSETVVVSLDGPLLADQAGQVLHGGLGAGQAGDGVNGLAGGPARRGVLPPPGDLDGLAGMRKVQAADVRGLQGAGPGAAVPSLAGCAAGRHLPPGQGPDLGVQQRLVALHDRDVLAFFWVTSQSRFARTVWRASKVTTAPARSTGPSSSVKWLVSLCLTSTSRWQQPPAMLGDAEQVNPGAVGAAGPAGGLAVHGHRP